MGRAERGRGALLAALALALLLLGGCASAARTVEAFTGVLTAEELARLDEMPALRSADLSGSDCYAEMLAWGEAHPQVALRYTVPLPDGRVVENGVTELDCSALRRDQVAALADCLRWLPALRAVNLGGTGENELEGEDISLLLRRFPDIRFSYRLHFRGAALPADCRELDLREAAEEEIEALLPWCPLLAAVRCVLLGEGGDAAAPRLPWELLQRLHQALPAAALDYCFTLYGGEHNLSDETLDLNHIAIDDQGALALAVARCMSRLRLLDMDRCGVDDEHMAAIRDALPETEVVWRIWFGTGYSVRTNVTKILASNPDKAGELTPENTVSLRYCTKVKYLDLGHNSYLGSIDFCRYMPDLEVLIVAMGDWSDCSALANCPKLEYAELQTSSLNDLSPLAELRQLRHLNICYCFALHDISPLYGLHELERLWIGCLTPIPPEQVETFRRLNPDCTVELTSVDPTQTYWRYIGSDETGHLILAPRYRLLREQFGYDDAPYCYSYIENDPLYHWHK